MRVAAVQPETVAANVDANLEECERLANEAALEGAQWILLPEFFTTGMGFIPKLAECSLPANGRATELLLSLAKRHGVNVGGSFLCRDDDGDVRNAFFLATPQGIAGRHDKDIPTMWENCFYIGGGDDGVLRAGPLNVGVALCLEFNRAQTVRRLRGKVDLVVGGSCKWGAPKGFPKYFQRHIERYSNWTPNFRKAHGVPGRRGQSLWTAALPNADCGHSVHHRVPGRFHRLRCAWEGPGTPSPGSGRRDRRGGHRAC